MKQEQADHNDSRSDIHEGRSSLAFKLSIVGFLVGMALIWSYFSSERERQESESRTALAAMRAQAKGLLLSEFPKMRFELSPPRDLATSMEPAIVFDGAKSEILIQGTIESYELPNKFARDTHQIIIPALARTDRGRFFTTGYAFHFRDPSDCVEPVSCGRLAAPRELSVEEARSWVFREPNATAADYERIFGEPMPPRQVPA